MAAILVNQDTAPTITAVISNSTGVVDLTSCTVFFQMRLASDRRWKINAECDITDATAGEVEYALAEGDLDFSGECSARFRVEYPDGTIQHTVPATTITVEPQ